LASAGFALAIAMLGTPLPTPLYSLYRERFGISELIITVIFATYAAGVIASLLLFGRLSDQVGRRRMLLPGLALAALSAIAFLIADGLALLLAGRVLAGLSAGIFTGTATARLVDLAGPERRARATLMATIANMCGLGCGPLLAGMLAQWAGSPLRLIFWVYLVLLIPATIGIWVMPEPVAATSRPRLRPQAQAVPTEMRTTFVEAALAGFAGFAVLGLFTAVAPAFLGQELGVTSRAVVGLVVFAVFAASMVGQAVLELVPEAVAMPAGCLALIAGMGVLALGLALPSLALLVLGGVVAGLGHGLAFRAGMTAVNTRAPAEHRARGGVGVLRRHVRRHLAARDRRGHPRAGNGAAHGRGDLRHRRGGRGRRGAGPARPRARTVGDGVSRHSSHYPQRRTDKSLPRADDRGGAHLEHGPRHVSSEESLDWRFSLFHSLMQGVFSAF
jgi:MFS family permease